MSDTNFSKPEWPQPEEDMSPSRYEAPEEEVAYNAHTDAPEENGKSATPLVIISLIIGFGIGWFAAGGDGATPKGVVIDDTEKDEQTEMVDTKNDDTTIEPPAAPIAVNVSVKDQFAGDRVIIDRLSLPVKSWVAVYEDNEAGEPGKILGARRFEAGDHAGVSVELLRNTVLDGKNFVIVHADDGDADFEKFEDVAVTNSDGSIFSVPFMTTLGSPRGSE